MVTKTWRLDSHIEFQMVSKAVPTPGRNEALIRVSAVSTEPGLFGLYRYSSGRGVGSNVAGVVVATGPQCGGRPNEYVPEINIGDEIWGQTDLVFVPNYDYNLPAPMHQFALAEYALVYCDRIGKRAPGSPVALADLAALPCSGGTSLEGLRAAKGAYDGHAERRWRPEQNITVLIPQGAGGTGTAAIQQALAMGASRVITSASPRNHASLYALGASLVIDYHAHNVWNTLPTDSVDIVWSNSERAERGASKESILRIVRRGGVFSTMFNSNAAGWLRGNSKGIQGVFYMGWCSGCYNMERPFWIGKPGGYGGHGNQTYEAMMRMILDGKLRPVIAARFPLREAARAYEAMARPHAAGKMMIDVLS